MKLTVLCCLLFVILLIPGRAFAATNSELLTKPSLMPGSPFYFVENIREKLDLFFTLDAAKKVEKMANFAQRRLAEANAFIQSGQVDAAKQQLAKYFDEYGQTLVASGKLPKQSDVQTSLENLVNNTSSELVALSHAYESLPETQRKSLDEAFAVVTTTQTNLANSAPSDLKAGLLKKIESARSQLVNGPLGKSGLNTIIPTKVITN